MSRPRAQDTASWLAGDKQLRRNSPGPPPSHDGRGRRPDGRRRQPDDRPGGCGRAGGTGLVEGKPVRSTWTGAGRHRLRTATRAPSSSWYAGARPDHRRQGPEPAAVSGQALELLRASRPGTRRAGRPDHAPHSEPWRPRPADRAGTTRAEPARPAAGHRRAGPPAGRGRPGPGRRDRGEGSDRRPCQRDRPARPARRRGRDAGAVGRRPGSPGPSVARFGGRSAGPPGPSRSRWP